MLPYKLETFTQVVGQEYAVSILKNVVRKRASAPKVYLLHGVSGTGKTSMVRVFAKDLLKLPSAPDGSDPVKGYLEISSYSLKSPEYIDKIMRIGKDKALSYSVIHFEDVYDFEYSSVLNSFMEELKNTFFMFSTVDVSAVPKTILNRSVRIGLTLLSDTELGSVLDEAAVHRGVKLSSTARSIILIRSRGSIKNALSLLTQYELGTVEMFESSMKPVYQKFEDFFHGCIKDGIRESVKKLAFVSNVPIAFLKEDLEEYFMHSLFFLYEKGDKGIFSVIGPRMAESVMSLYFQNKENACVSTSDFYSFCLLLGSKMSDFSKSSGSMGGVSANKFSKKR